MWLILVVVFPSLLQTFISLVGTDGGGKKLIGADKALHVGHSPTELFLRCRGNTSRYDQADIVTDIIHHRRGL